jgi:hypothetical protein
LLDDYYENWHISSLSPLPFRPVPEQLNINSNHLSIGVSWDEAIRRKIPNIFFLNEMKVDDEPSRIGMGDGGNAQLSNQVSITKSYVARSMQLKDGNRCSIGRLNSEVIRVSLFFCPNNLVVSKAFD